MIRTFVALEIPDDTRNKLNSFRNENTRNHQYVRWEANNKLHFTLKFLGNTDESLIEKISAGIQKIVQKYSPLHLSFNKFGLFKKEGLPKILWAGINDNENLVNLAQGIDKVCIEYGFPEERRKFKPHLTILRLKGNENLEEINRLLRASFAPVEFVADTITFYKSELKQNGSIYTSLKKFNLK